VNAANERLETSLVEKGAKSELTKKPVNKKPVNKKPGFPSAI
jgi:hypothetical protein